jgi:hypothetical protein
MSVATLPPRRWRYTPRTAMFTDLTAFLQDHQAHGKLVGGASEPGPSGYLVTVACPCGVTFERRVTELDAAADLLRLAGRN